MIIERLHLAAGLLPAEGAISSLTLAELATGPHANDDPRERALRQLRLNRSKPPSTSCRSTVRQLTPTAGSMPLSAGLGDGLAAASSICRLPLSPWLMPYRFSPVILTTSVGSRGSWMWCPSDTSPRSTTAWSEPGVGTHAGGASSHCCTCSAAALARNGVG